MAEEDSEKTEAASPRRLSEARKRGQVVNSRELSILVGMTSAYGGLALFGSQLLQALQSVLRQGLAFDWRLQTPIARMTEQLFEYSLTVLLAAAPLLALLAFAAFITPILLHGWLFSTEALAPKFNRINPLSGLKRMFSTQSLVELTKALIKTTLLGGVALWAIWLERTTLIGLMRVDFVQALSMLWALGLKVLLYALGGLLVVAAIDVPYQFYQHAKTLRMSMQEVKRESKESEGDPQTKSRVRQIQREMARRRMMAAVPTANVIVTNPSDYAIALRYRVEMAAPVVVAKGRGEMAARITAIGQTYKIARLRSPRLARALYYRVELEGAIPQALYLAVAEVLAYVHQLKRYEKEGGPEPELPTDEVVPEGWDQPSGQKAF